MKVNQKSNISVVLSVIAVAIACTTIYFEFFRPIKLDFAVARHSYISNTMGGIPDIRFQIAVRANGPATKAITIDSAKIVLKNIDTNESYTLISNPLGDIFPLVLQGGNSVTKAPLFVVDYSLTEAIDLYDEWCNKLSKEFPMKTELIDEIRNKLKEPYLPVRSRDNTFQQTTNQSNFDLEDIFALYAEEQIELDEQISNLLALSSVEQLRKILFFLAGNYEIQIEIMDPFDQSLAVQKRKFSIDEVVSKSLQHRFNDNILVAMEADSA